MDTIVGMLWNKNEGDILEEILNAALPHVDSLFIADDQSTDNSWKIIQSFASKHQDKVEYIRNKREIKHDKGQRTALLNEIRRRYKPENTWVQIFESDIMILDTNIREAIKKFGVMDFALSWFTLNAVRSPNTWKEVDTYPKWKTPIKEIMPKAHLMEMMLYTFRPLPKLYYSPLWRPWPHGFSNYSKGNPVKTVSRDINAPLLAHYGYRGPTHFYQKFKKAGMGDFHSKYKSWDLRTVESVDRTVSFFNGEYNGNKSFEMSRNGWTGWIEKRKIS